MLQNCILKLYRMLRLETYRRMFGAIREKNGSLSATEAFSADVIYLLHEPTVGQFAEAIGISQPNATYKVNSLMAKGYLQKMPSESDKREVRLKTGGKFESYFLDNQKTLLGAVEKLNGRFSAEELETTERVLNALYDEIS